MLDIWVQEVNEKMDVKELHHPIIVPLLTYHSGIHHLTF